jgi:integrase
MPLKRLLREVTAVVEPVPYTARGITRYAVDLSFVTDAGEPIRIQRRGFLTRGEAILWAEREVVLVKTGAKKKESVAAKKAAALVTADVLAILMNFWRDTGRKKLSTLQVDSSAISKHLLPTIGQVPWSELTQQQVDRLVRDSQGMTTPRHLSVLKIAIRDSRRAGLEPPNVQVDTPRYCANARTDYINADELEKICAKAPPLMAAAFRALFHTGLRIGEFLAMEWADLDFGRGRETMTVNRTAFRLKGGYSVTSPKNGKHRTVPLNVSAVRALTEIASIMHPGRGFDAPSGAPLDQRLVLPSEEGGYRHKSTVHRALERACKAAGIRRITPHTLRHSFGSNLVQAGADLYTVCTLMGHSSVAMTQRYAHLSQDGLRSSACKLDTLTCKVKKKVALEVIN